ncbi:hypothetical protein LCGC14_1212900 [marine sediment metagenome]|uniref:Uncharacterized protein n=1 Tax=marine sediment metagenome TaxID=412755 RepID=A0A0F9NVU5_9ZZZZ
MDEIMKENLEKAIDILKTVESVGPITIQGVPTEFFANKEFRVESKIVVTTNKVICEIVMDEDNIRVISQGLNMTHCVTEKIKDKLKI